MKQVKLLRIIPFVGLLCVSGSIVAVREVPIKTGLVFVANVSGTWDLFISAIDGSQTLRLSQTAVDELSPALSPDGSEVAYETSDGALWRMPLTTRHATKIDLPSGRYGHPAWLSDGSGLMFTSYVVHPPDEDSDFSVYNFKDGKMQLFLKQTGSQDYAAISPDGSKIAYMSAITTLISGMEGIVNQQLWVANLRDGKAAPLFLTAAKDRHPAWSPDGRQLAFSSDRKGKENIWITDLEGHAEQITDDAGSAVTPAWSPNGKEIVYVSTASGKSELMIVNVETRKTRKVSPFGAKLVEVRDPQWH
jgi:TolB protein